MDAGPALRHPDCMGKSASSLPATASLELRLGALLARAGLVPRDKLAQALGLQAARDARLGELLVELGLIDRVELEAILLLQRDLRTAPEHVVAQDRLRLGRLLLDAGVIDERTLNEALTRHRASGRRLGETLVETGAISRQTLEQFLHRQRRLVAVGMAGLAVVGAAATPDAQAGGTHAIGVSATVLRHAAISAVRAPAEVRVTQADVERGYVEVDQPVELDVRTNDAQGVVVGFSVNVPQVAGVELAGEPGRVRVNGASGLLHVLKEGRGLVTQTVRLQARLLLSPGVAPGVMAWPVALFIAPG